MKELNLTLEIDDYLSEDVQLYIFLKNILKLNDNFFEIDKLKDFLIECK